MAKDRRAQAPPLGVDKLDVHMFRLRSGRRLLRPVFVVALAASMLAPSRVLAADDDNDTATDYERVTFVGAGWGHGVGLSQFGAYGAARDGWSSEQILTHFYQGTSLEVMGEGNLSVPDDLWVGLDRDLDTITLVARQIYYSDPPGPTAAVTVTRGEESWEMAVNDRLEITWVEGTRDCDLAFTDSGGASIAETTGPCDLDITWDGDAEQPTRKIEVEGCEFRDWNGYESAYPGPSLDRPCQYGRGSMVIRSPGDGGAGPFDMSVVTDIESYLLGISEMPYYWGLAQNGGMAALEAQAIAARSYARELQLYRGTPGSNSCGAWCHVRDDTYDQRYVGWGHGWSTWTAAVENTAGRVITHPQAPSEEQRIVRGYYSSSSGGATENADEVGVGGTEPRAYFTSVDDHWALDSTLNSNASWTVTFSTETVADRVGLDALLYVDVTARNTSTSARTVRFMGTKGGNQVTIDLASSTVKSLFGLKSIYFDVAFGEPAPFGDISDSIHYDDIVYIAERGITKGCNPPFNTEYCPDGLVTRGEMAAFLVRALDLSGDGTTDRFTDDDGSVFEADINRLAAAGITKGCNQDGTRYCPNDLVTRGEMAAFLVRGFGYEDPGAGDWFVDDDDSIFEGDIDRIKTAGVTVGCNPPENTNFCPDDPVGRDQMASFLARALRG
jgi:SpoIID/LytB domain protein